MSERPEAALAPIYQGIGHPRPSHDPVVRDGLPADSLGCADSNSGSDSSNQPQAEATGDDARRAHVAQRLGGMSGRADAPYPGRSRTAVTHRESRAA